MNDTETPVRSRAQTWWRGAVAITLFATAALLYMPAASAATSNVSYGQTINGSISVPGDSNTYRWTAAAGDRLSIDRKTGSLLKMTLRDPSNNVVWNLKPFDDAVQALPSAGQYQLTISYGTSSNTGSYSFAINNVRLPQGFNVAYGTTFSNGVPTAGMGNIELPGAADRYLFQATAKDRLSIDRKAGSLLKMTLVDPVGAVVWNNKPFDDSVLTLARTGRYQLTIDHGGSANVGTYSFALNNVRNPQYFSIASGTTVSNGVPKPGMGNIELPGSQDRYQFAGRPGQRLSIDRKSGSLLKMTLWAPNGTLLWNAKAYDDAVVDLPQNGTYTLAIHPGGDSTVTGAYSFAMNLVVK